MEIDLSSAGVLSTSIGPQEWLEDPRVNSSGSVNSSLSPDGSSLEV